MKQKQFFYNVFYSDGVTIIDNIVASNLKEAKQIAAKNSKNYNTSYYMVSRCYNGGLRGSSPTRNWH